MGVESWWNEGKPMGRKSGRIISKAVTKACNPNEVRAVQPRRERSAHDESSVAENMLLSETLLSNMMSSKMECGCC
jgi:hypothetical protein